MFPKIVLNLSVHFGLNFSDAIGLVILLSVALVRMLAIPLKTDFEIIFE